MQPQFTSGLKNIADRSGGIENKDSLVVKRNYVKLPKEPFQKKPLCHEIWHDVGHFYILGEILNFL